MPHYAEAFMLKPNPDMVARKVGDELLLVPVSRDVADLGAVYQLNEVGTRIWELIGEGNAPDAIVTRLEEEFEASREEIAADVERFVGEMVEIRALVEDEP
jgi:hypothetical protein